MLRPHLPCDRGFSPALEQTDGEAGGNMPSFNVGASEFVPGNFGSNAFFEGPKDAPQMESPTHSSLMKPSTDTADQRWNQYGQW